jgi:hypothetical protein
MKHCNKLLSRSLPVDTTDWPPAARRYVARLQAIIERDRTAVARGTVAVRNAIKAREWLRLGRGSYEYDDDRWRDEFGALIRNSGGHNGISINLDRMFGETLAHRDPWWLYDEQE